MRLAGFSAESFVDGPGLRYVIFTQGCPHHCKGCHNQTTWDYATGNEVEAKEIIKIIKKLGSKYRGITLSGGEPFLQAKDLKALADAAHDKGLDVVAYSGWTFEELLDSEDKAKTELLKVCDILVDGRFVESLKDIGLAFRGSSNQRVVDVKKSLASGKVVLWQK